jgi:hypothetical protein
MRAFLPLTVLALSTIVACRCSPPTPTPVTLRIKNTSRDLLLVRDGKGQHGLMVQRQVTGQWFGFDDLPCSCQTCDLICDRSCRCPDAGITEFVLAVPPNGQAERQWDGVVQVAGFNCGQQCLVPENAPTDETFRLELCFVNQIDGVEVPADGGRVLGAFPAPGVQTCTTREFQPQQRLVEISPARGADCTTTSDCRGSQELCLNGSCTAGCPSTTFPAQPELVVSYTSMGFFAESRDLDGGRTLQTGTGRITATQFSGETMQVSLSNTGGSGRFEVKLPGGLGGPSLPTTTDLKILIAIRSEANKVFRGVVVRDARTDELLFAADTAIDGPILTAVDLAPFNVATEAEPVGCRVESTCGKLVFTRQVLSATGGTTGQIVAEPGKLSTGSIVTATGAASYRFWNVTSGQYGSPTCDSYRPYAFWKL